MTHYLLDACAVLAVFKDEPEKQKVLDLVEQARIGEIRLSINIVQLLEVYYDCVYVAGEDAARARIKTILAEPISVIETISFDVMYEAGRFKTSYSMSLADSIAAATAKQFTTTLVTKDSEFQPAERAGEFSVLWLR